MENAVYYISLFGDFLCSLSPHTFLTYSIDTSIVFMGSSLYHQCLSLFVDLFDRFATGNKLFAVLSISLVRAEYMHSLVFAWQNTSQNSNSK